MENGDQKRETRKQGEKKNHTIRDKQKKARKRDRGNNITKKKREGDKERVKECSEIQQREEKGMEKLGITDCKGAVRE